MTIVSQAEYARLRGVSRKTVSQWKSQSWLVLRDGGVDVEATDKVLARYRRGGVAGNTAKTGNSRVGNSGPGSTASGGTRPNRARQPTSVVSEADGWKTAKAGGALPSELGVSDDDPPAVAAAKVVAALGADMSFDEARRVKENYLALLQKLEYEQKEGAAIDLAVAERVFFEAARSTRDAWLGFPSKFAPYVAADLGLNSDQVIGVLERYVYQQVSALGLGEQAPDFSGA